MVHSVGDPNAEERQLAGELAPVDVAIFALTPLRSLRLTRLYVPTPAAISAGLYLPDHHDGIWGLWLDNGLAPLFMRS